MERIVMLADDLARKRERMVETQLGARGVRNARVLEAMRAVPREAFVPEELAEFAYQEGPLPIGERQTISQP
jgi:protein-L-isoaspartate(D-aspartate) O-methyltransferase